MIDLFIRQHLDALKMVVGVAQLLVLGALFIILVVIKPDLKKPPKQDG